MEPAVVSRVIEADSEEKAPHSDFYELIEGKPDALVIHCSDPRFQSAFHDFLRDELGITMPAVIAVPGSTGSFGVQSFLPKNWYALRNQIKLMTEHNDFPRVVLINHDDCKGYASIAHLFKGLTNLVSEQRKHLKALAGFIQKEFLSGAKFELYQARIINKDGKKYVDFEQVI